MPKTTKHLKQHQFKKGAPSANPHGARIHNPAIKALSKLTVETFREVIELVLTSNLAALKALAENPKTSAVQVGIATAFMKAIRNGDYDVIERIAQRLVGKVPDVVNVNSVNNSTVNTKVTDIDRIALKKAMKEIESEI